MNLEKWNDPAHWDATVATYEAQARPFTGHFAERALARLDLRPGTKLLDVATGTGAAALVAAHRGADVVAIDFSAGMVAQVASHGIPNLSARRMDGQALDLPDGAFDAAVSLFGVFMFPDWRAGLAEIARVTRAGGEVAIGTWHGPDGAATNLLLADIRRALGLPVVTFDAGSGIIVLSDQIRLRAELERVGFEEVEVNAVTHDFLLEIATLDDATPLFAHAPGWSELDPHQHAAILAEVRVRAERDAVDGALAVPSTALIATGRRT